MKTGFKKTWWKIVVVSLPEGVVALVVVVPAVVVAVVLRLVGLVAVAAVVVEVAHSFKKN